MANIGAGVPLATAVVQLNLVYNKANIQQQTGAMVKNATDSSVKALTKSSNIYAGLYSMLLRLQTKLNMASLATGAFFGGAIYKYMMTTEKGAQQLRLSMGGLRYSFDQLLARIGRYIASSYTLTAVIGKLKAYLDGIDDKKIGQILNAAKWLVILTITNRILTAWMAVRATLIKVAAEIVRLKVVNVGSAAAGAAATAAGGAAGGAGSAAAGAGAIEIFKRFAPIAAKFMLVFGAIVAFLEGMGFTVTDVMSALATGFDFLIKVITSAAMILSAGFYSLGAAAVALKDMFMGDMDAWQKYSDKMDAYNDKFIAIWSKDKKKPEDMKFLGQGTSTSSFAGLNAAMQQNITLENEMKSRRDNTDAINANTEALKAAGNGRTEQAGKYENYNPTSNYSPFNNKNMVLGF